MGRPGRKCGSPDLWGGAWFFLPEALLRENPGLRIALLYCDLDLYGPTKFCLEHFYPLVVNGGIVCFDEYGLIPWEGESRAVDEFLAEHRLSPRLRRFPFSPSPCGYFVKGENPEPAHPEMPRR